MSEYTSPFARLLPVSWKSRSELVYSTRGDHGLHTQLLHHNLNNSHATNFLRAPLLSYAIGTQAKPIYTVEDLLRQDMDVEDFKHLKGHIAERVARRLARKFLSGLHPQGSPISLPRETNQSSTEGFIVANSEAHILKIQQYPNLLVLRKGGEGTFGYEKVAEIDGFFDYRFYHQRHLVIMESKVQNTAIDADHVINDIFVPLSEMFPDTHFAYMLISTKDGIFRPRTKRRQLRPSVVDLYHRLREINVELLPLTFPQTVQQFEEATEHIITQSRIFKSLEVKIQGEATVQPDSITFRNGTPTPVFQFLLKNGAWVPVVLPTPTHLHLPKEDS